jgi:predicted nucleic acid-binding protein
MSFVIDASIIAAFAFEETDDPRPIMAIDALNFGEAMTPALFYFEVRNALVVGERRGRSTPSRSSDFLRDLAALPIRIVPLPDSDAIMRLSRKRGLSVYDAAYLEVACRERLPLATLDRALERAAAAEGVPLFGA